AALKNGISLAGTSGLTLLFILQGQCFMNKLCAHTVQRTSVANSFHLKVAKPARKVAKCCQTTSSVKLHISDVIT
ncbi:MAG: hypothetical protein ACRC9V_16060, partial [Aeromonas sp.]